MSHRYDGGRLTLNSVSFAIEHGEVASLMGPSGSGKTTALLCIAGLEKITTGQIALNNAVLSAANRHQKPEKRKIGMVFQDFALFPHLSAADNIGFGLRALSAAAARQRIGDMLDLCDIAAIRDAFPHELSGGEQQRVALARALATDPDLLLLDEPFSRLDPKLHEKISREVRDILKSREQTTLVVTHNQNEAFLLSDVGGVINEGAICQWDTMDNLYHRPRCAFVADFVGDGVLINGAMLTDGTVQTAVGRLAAEDDGDAGLLFRAGDAVKALLRPDDVLFGDDDGDGGAAATVEKRVFRGATSLYSLRLCSGEVVTSVLPSRVEYRLGAAVWARARVRRLVLFPGLGA